MPAPGDTGQRGAGGRLELRQREVLVRIDQIDEVVRHGRLRLWSGLGRPDVHAAVDAHGVDRDDFAVAPAQGERQCCL
jgi:hypothetical protein